MESKKRKISDCCSNCKESISLHSDKHICIKCFNLEILPTTKRANTCKVGGDGELLKQNDYSMIDLSQCVTTDSVNKENLSTDDRIIALSQTVTSTTNVSLVNEDNNHNFVDLINAKYDSNNLDEVKNFKRHKMHYLLIFNILYLQNMKHVKLIFTSIGLDNHFQSSFFKTIKTYNKLSIITDELLELSEQKSLSM